MQLINTFFLYGFACSIILVYGIGLEKSFFGSRPGISFMSRFPIIILEILLSVPSLWFIQQTMLIPAGMYYLVPMTVVLMCGLIHLLVLLLFPLLRTDDSGERLFTFGLSYLAVAEGLSFTDAMIAAGSGLTALFILSSLLFAIRSRIAPERVHPDLRGSPLILISLGLLSVILYASDISWWLQGAAR
jgi:Na+-translocating ferredoxin:NAD+ oxidoreductase RnfA subunit